MKFIHLTDTHVIGGDRLLYGANPARRLARAVDSINEQHGDAGFVIIIGDLTHWGDDAAYDAFATQIARLTMPVHLMMGNHDDTPAFAARFPAARRDNNGFVQFSFEAAGHRAICLDTSEPGTHAGRLCPARLGWLRAELEADGAPVLLFMHHPPFKTGIAAMDAIMLQNAEAFHATIAPHKDRIRHLFFGHVHRAIFGTWRGVSYSCMRGLNHQVALDLSGATQGIQGDLVDPAYGVVLLEDDMVTVHLHEFDNKSPRFSLSPAADVDGATYQLSMVHPGFQEP